ncbi:MAG: hypothetical protein WBB28_20815 [Crinalium sp.]
MQRWLYIPEDAFILSAGPDIYVICSDWVIIGQATLDNPAIPVSWRQISGRMVIIDEPNNLNTPVHGLSQDTVGTVIDQEPIILELSAGSGINEKIDTLTIYTTPTSLSDAPSLVPEFSLSYISVDIVSTTLYMGGDIQPPASLQGSFIQGDPNSVRVNWKLPANTENLYSTVLQRNSTGIYIDVAEFLVSQTIDCTINVIPGFYRFRSVYKSLNSERIAYGQPFVIDRAFLSKQQIPVLLIASDDQITLPSLDAFSSESIPSPFAFNTTLIPVETTDSFSATSLDGFSSESQAVDTYLFARGVSPEPEPVDEMGLQLDSFAAEWSVTSMIFNRSNLVI